MDDNSQIRFVALFRGINAGGKHIVKMDSLKKMLAGLGYKNVRTYIQSGNALFDAESKPNDIKEKIQAAFLDTFGFDSPVILRTKDEFIAAMDALPFSAEEIKAATLSNPNVEHLYVYFMDNAPSFAVVNAINTGYSGHDKLFFGVREIYLLCHESVRDSKLAAALVKLNMLMTARNWKTLNKLRAMIEE